MCPVGSVDLKTIKDGADETAAHVSCWADRKLSQYLAFLGAVVRDANLDRHISAQLLVSCEPDCGIRPMTELFDNRVSFLESIVQLDWVIAAGSVSVQWLDVADVFIKGRMGCAFPVWPLCMKSTSSGYAGSRKTSDLPGAEAASQRSHALKLVRDPR